MKTTMAITNQERVGTPVRLGMPALDIAGSLDAALGILLAQHERTKCGKGQFVEAALYDCDLSVLHPHTATICSTRAACPAAATTRTPAFAPRAQCPPAPP
jgi:formyl-CoA transferase